MAYSADTFVADEQPTTAKWNKLWSNDASFNDGTGIADDAILTRHLADAAVTPANLLAGTGTAWTWDSWTPTWGGGMTIGNATVVAKYKQIGKTVIGRLDVTAGGTTSCAGGSVPTYTLPVAAVSAYGLQFPLGQFILRGTIVGSGYTRWASTTTADLAAYQVSGSNVIDAGIHEAFGSGDRILVNFAYEAA